jgi:hypothetical protein
VNQRIFNVPVLLSFNGGFVDTAGFLAFKDLFTAHVTGNFVTIAATLISGASGVVTKMLALPVFCAVVVITRLVSTRIGQTSHCVPWWPSEMSSGSQTMRCAGDCPLVPGERIDEPRRCDACVGYPHTPYLIRGPF